jgi:tRNA dimethylallyltransferase
MEQKPKVLVIVGPTASGKTSLSTKLAKTFSGEVISADSRQVYKGLDIGTGKVTTEEMQGVPHHLLDVADPHETYTVTDYMHDADTAITDIHSRQKLPVIVGGTFLYVDTLLGKMSAPEVPPNEVLRSALETLDTAVLAEKLQRLDPVRYKTIDTHNRRRLIRAIEIAEALGSVPTTKVEKRYKSLILGVDIAKEELHANIHIRLLERLDDGMIAEVQKLHAEGLTYERMEALGLEYRYIARHLQGLLSYENMVTELETKIRQYAKRQMTWLKRDEEIVWVKKDEMECIEKLVSDFIKS